MRPGCRGAHGLFDRIAVDAVAGHALEPALGRRAVEPLGEEGRDHRIADRELADALADGGNLARSIGHRNAVLGGRDHPLDHRIVMIVETGRAQSHRDLAGPGGSGIGQVDQSQIVERRGGFELDGLHG